MIALMITYLIGIFLRDGLIGAEWLVDRVELATPLNSWKRLTEGIALYRQGVSPYSGVLFHETPITLAFFHFVTRNFYTAFINKLFIFTDLATAYIIGLIGWTVAKNLLEDQAKNVKSYHTGAMCILLKEENVRNMATFAQVAYLYHPYLIANCAAKTTTVFSNLFTALFILSMLRRQQSFACFCLAVLAYQSLYPLMLIVPLCLTLMDEPKADLRSTIISTVVQFITFLSGLLFASKEIMGSWDFVWSTYGFILSVPELTPNMGLFWYFFTEMFEHFRVFFVCTFQLNVFIYLIPLTIRLRNQPYLLTISLMTLIAIFKSYPCFGDVGLYMALLPMVSYLFPFMKQLFIVAMMFVATTVLGPIQHQLWIYNGSANANYFFAINLVFGTAQIFLITDILFAYVKREFYLRNDVKSIIDSQNTKEGPKLLLQ